MVLKSYPQFQISNNEQLSSNHRHLEFKIKKLLQFFTVREENKHMDHDPTCGSESRERSGYKQNFIPSEAPGSVTPRIRRIISIIQGNVAVTYTTQQEEVIIRKIFSYKCNKEHPLFCYNIKTNEQKTTTTTNSTIKSFSGGKGAFDALVFIQVNFVLKPYYLRVRKGQHVFIERLRSILFTLGL